MLKLIYIFGHVLIVNSRCYGRCYVKNLIPLSTFLKFHTHLEENLVRSFRNVFDKSSRVLILAFPRNWIFHGQPHLLGYHSPLKALSNNSFLACWFRSKIALSLRSREINKSRVEKKSTCSKYITNNVYLPVTIMRFLDYCVLQKKFNNHY